jgi:hypothetical protein
MPFLEVLPLAGSFFQLVGGDRSTTAFSFQHAHRKNLAAAVSGFLDTNQQRNT